VWWFILHLLILPFRSPKSAQKYTMVWTPDGSPLKVWTDRQASLLLGALGERGHDVSVAYAMRYGNPSIASVLDRLHAERCDRILVVAMYPQYSAATTASTFDAVNAWSATVRNAPAFRFVRSFHDDPGYVDALASHVEAFRARRESALEPRRKLLMSFHGVPKRSLLMGDPYHCECLKTARLVAERLQLPADQWVVSFQSRFGKAEWLHPYTTATLKSLATADAAGLDVFCPGFPADCLETLEEIAMEGRDTWREAGGRDYRYIPCLNDDPHWIAALATLAETHLQGWPTRRDAIDASAAAALEASRRRAIALGAAA
jgi:ferrochelatase